MVKTMEGGVDDARDLGLETGLVSTILLGLEAMK
jgi:hypothetical protein